MNNILFLKLLLSSLFFVIGGQTLGMNIQQPPQQIMLQFEENKKTGQQEIGSYDLNVIKKMNTISDAVECYDQNNITCPITIKFKKEAFDMFMNPFLQALANNKSEDECVKSIFQNFDNQILQNNKILKAKLLLAMTIKSDFFRIKNDTIDATELLAKETAEELQQLSQKDRTEFVKFVEKNNTQISDIIEDMVMQSILPILIESDEDYASIEKSESTNGILSFQKKFNQDNIQCTILSDGKCLATLEGTGALAVGFKNDGNLYTKKIKNCGSPNLVVTINNTLYKPDSALFSNKGDFCLLWFQDHIILFDIKNNKEIKQEDLIIVHTYDEIMQQQDGTAFPFAGYKFYFNAAQELVVLWNGARHSNWVYIIKGLEYAPRVEKFSQSCFIEIINLTTIDLQKKFKRSGCNLFHRNNNREYEPKENYFLFYRQHLDMNPKKQNIGYFMGGMFGNETITIYDFAQGKKIAVFKEVGPLFEISNDGNALLFRNVFSDNRPSQLVCACTGKVIQTFDSSKNVNFNNKKSRLIVENEDDTEKYYSLKYFDSFIDL